MKTIDDVLVTGRRVLVRADLNVPLDGTWITDVSAWAPGLPCGSPGEPSVSLR